MRWTRTEMRSFHVKPRASELAEAIPASVACHRPASNTRGSNPSELTLLGLPRPRYMSAGHTGAARECGARARTQTVPVMQNDQWQHLGMSQPIRGQECRRLAHPSQSTSACSRSPDVGKECVDVFLCGVERCHQADDSGWFVPGVEEPVLLETFALRYWHAGEYGVGLD